jgi:hypothetical protein
MQTFHTQPTADRLTQKATWVKQDLNTVFEHYFVGVVLGPGGLHRLVKHSITELYPWPMAFELHMAAYDRKVVHGKKKQAAGMETSRNIPGTFGGG